MIAVVPIALLANVLRVSVLVIAGHHAGGPIEGLPHAVIGIAAFVFSVGCLLLLTERAGWRRFSTAMPADHPSCDGRVVLGIAAAALLLIYTPLIVWMATAWCSSPLDRIGVVFFGLGVTGLTLVWRKFPRAGKGQGAMGLLALAMLLAALAAMLSIHILSAFSALLALFGTAVFWRGWRFATRVLPLFGVMWLGMPTVHFQLRKLIELTGESPLLIVVHLISGALVCIALAETWLAFRDWDTAGGAPQRKVRVNAGALSFICVLGLVGHLTASDRSHADLSAARLQVAFLQGDWTGSEAEIPEATLALLGSSNALAWSYVRASDGSEVELLITAIAGDRHLAHPPEYCLNGACWKIRETAPRGCALGDGRVVEMTRLLLDREGQLMALACWFEDGEGTTCASYKQMFAADLRRRLVGRKSDWRLYRVMSAAPGPGAKVDAFLQNFRID